MSIKKDEQRAKHAAYVLAHPRDAQEKGQKYVEIHDDAPSSRAVTEQGAFFLERYRRIDPSVRVVEPKAIAQALRVNTLRTSDDLLRDRMASRAATLEKIPFLQHGHFVTATFSLGATPEYLFGQYYLQSPLSQLVCEVLAPPLGATVLDMASAPGGKTTYIATMVGNDGRVIALDNDTQRLASVRNNVERLGITNTTCVKKDARFSTDLQLKFTHILLDAPCSGNFCSEAQWFGKRTIEDIKHNSRTQRELLKSAYACLAPGGRLVYSTCSLEPEEDEVVIDYALKRYPDLTVVPLDTLPLGDAGTTTWEGAQLDSRIAGTRRFWPHKTGMEGFFIALLEKKAAE